MPPGRFAAAAIGAAALFSSLSVGGQGCRGDPIDAASPSPAAAFHREGLDAFARWDERGMFQRMRAAWEADPTYIPAIVDLLRYYDRSARLPSDVRAALDSLTTDDPRGSGLCARFVLHRAASFADIEIEPAAWEPTLRHDDAHPCALFARLHLPGPATPPERLQLAESLWRRFPASPRLADDFLLRLAGQGDWQRLLSAAEGLANGDGHPLLRARGFAWRVIALHALGRDDQAAGARDGGHAFVARAEPGTRFAYFDALCWVSDFVRPRRDGPRWALLDAVQREAMNEIYALIERADLYVGSGPRQTRAVVLLDRGRLSESLELWDELVAVADTFIPMTQLAIYMRRGRTLLKLGDHRNAERDLLAARALTARADNMDYALEVEHNLLHLYDAMGRDAEALEAGRNFVDYTTRMPLHAVRMMAYHDLGGFLQRRGQHEAARHMFAAMLTTIDSMNDYHHWAAEHYEMTGDLDHAVALYRRSWQENQLDATRSLAALARFTEATGDDEGALTFARAHDERIEWGYPEHAPITPGLLARGGRLDEAIAALQAARETAGRQGQAAAWARLTLELAALELEHGSLGAAAVLADSAAAAAESVAEAAVIVRGRAVAALARVRLAWDDRPGALARLRDAASEAEELRQPSLRIEVLQMLGDALSVLEEVDGALAAYARAATVSDSLAMSLSHDVDRAGFRGEQLRISDRALACVLAARDHPQAASRFTAWSMRRKSRSIGDGGGGAAALWLTASQRMSRIQSALAPDRAIIDYVVLESAVAALVVTTDRARIVRLPVARESLDRRVRALRAGIAPRVGSFVDLSRASFNVSLARRLYADLLAPLESYLAGRTRLTVIPDAPLQLVPFDALITAGPDSAPAHLLDRYTVRFATSLVGAEADDGGLPAGIVLAVSGPAANGAPPATSLEVEAIARALPGRDVVSLRGDRATEAAVRGQAARAAVLHFATHARPNDHDPDFAHLCLAPADDDDGLLHAYEIRALRLPGSLVILSACESAAGRLVPGEGPLSLSRAFLQAGAGAVLGTLWPVGDEAAAELMEALHANLARGQPPVAALREAKRALRATHSEPFYWAPFVLVTRGL